MNIELIIRAWKDEDFRTSLSEQELNLLPENPVGEVELNEDELGMQSGQIPGPTAIDCSVTCG